MLAELIRDLRYALRSLRRHPTLTATVVLTLAIGIGVNAVVFSAMDAVLLRDAPVSEPDRLVDVYTTSGSNRFSNSSYPDYFDLRASNTFASLAAYVDVSMTMDAGERTEPLTGQLVSGNYFDVLGVRPAMGRAFSADEDRIGAPVRVAVISDRLWRRTFASDHSIFGRTIRLNGDTYTLIGVTPPGFSGLRLGVAADVWIPTALQPEVDPASAALRRSRGHGGKFDLRGSRGLSLTGRLPAGQTLTQSAAQADAVAQSLQVAHPDTNRDRVFTLTPLGDGRGLRTTTAPVLRSLAGAVVMVLLVACVNVAGLMLSRAVSREREVAVRVAIGASRTRLIRQWLAESLLLGVFGALGALVVVQLGSPLLHTFVIPDAVELPINARLLTFTLAIGLISGVVFGLAPILHTLRRSGITVLRAKEGTTSAFAGRLRAAFVVFQVALSLMLIVGSGLFLRTVRNAYSVGLGYDIEQVLVATLNIAPRGHSAEAGWRTYEDILARVNALPGVTAASAARMTVLSGSARSTAVSTDGRPIDRDAGNSLGVRANVVSHGYFETMKIPILRGRVFDASDRPGGLGVTVVSKLLAEALWPGRDPVGQTMRDETQDLVVIGVVPDTVYASTLDRDHSPTYYLPLAQNYELAVALHVRTTRSNVSALIPSLREAVRQVDSQLALDRPELLADVLARTLSPQRMMATLVGLFGATALLLTVLGLYGVMAQVSTQRMSEVGLRLALGATPGSIATMLLGHGLRLLAVGTVFGVVGALIATRYLEARLFGVSATDPLTFAASIAVLALAGLGASLIPALRAMRTDPIIVMRQG